MIPYEDLGRLNAPYADALQAGLAEVLHSGRLVLGEWVQRFEEDWAAYCGRRFCIGVASGLDALTLSLVGFGLQPGDEVVVASNAYFACVLSVLQAGLTPVLVEPDLATYNLDPARVEAALGPRTRAIMAVHMYGRMCDVPAMRELAQRHGLWILEDCAQAHGAPGAGAFGRAAAFSFYPTKNLGALGDAGAIVTDDEELALQLRALRNYGSDRKYCNRLIGWNSRLDELQARFLHLKLAGLGTTLAHKRRLAALYLDGLGPQFVLPDPQSHAFHIFNIRHPRRDELRAYLLENGIGSEIHYPVAPADQPALAGRWRGEDFPVARLIHATTLSLPISPIHSEADITRVIDCLNRFA